jgi:YHS domain-containing protein
MRYFSQIAAFVVVVTASTAAEAQQVWRWAKNLDEARRSAAETNRLVLIHFGANDCAPCQKLEREVFSQPGFGEGLVQDYVGVKVNVDLYPATARQFQVESWPTDVIITPEGQIVEKFISPRSGPGYVAKMAQVAGTHHHAAAVAASPYQRPVVNYGAVRVSAHQGPAAASVAQPAVNQTPPAAAERFTNTQPAAPSAPPQVAQAAPQRDRYADYYEQQGSQGYSQDSYPAQNPYVQPPQQPVTPTQDAYAGYQAPAAPPVAPVSPPVTSVAPPQQDRYADYRAGQHATAVAPPASLDGTYQRPVAPPMQAGPVASQPPVANASTQPSSKPAVTQNQLPAGAAPIGLDGYCPVTLMEQQRWVSGDVRYGITHEGRTYLFTSAAERDKFWQQPHRFCPVMAGNDPVIATDNGQMLTGRREHGLFVNGRIYLFASEETLTQFERNRDRYVQNVNRTLR